MMSAYSVTQVISLSLILLVGTNILGKEQVSAQSLQNCQPPRNGEYLLLVPTQDSTNETLLQQLLPTNALLTFCNYLSDRVVRIEGFTNTDVASAWAQYLENTTGLQAFVIHLPEGESPTFTELSPRPLSIPSYSIPEYSRPIPSISTPAYSSPLPSYSPSSGRCRVPSDTARDGSRCGGRAASER